MQRFRKRGQLGTDAEVGNSPADCDFRAVRLAWKPASVLYAVRCIFSVTALLKHTNAGLTLALVHSLISVNEQ